LKTAETFKTPQPLK